MQFVGTRQCVMRHSLLVYWKVSASICQPKRDIVGEGLSAAVTEGNPFKENPPTEMINLSVQPSNALNGVPTSHTIREFVGAAKLSGIVRYCQVLSGAVGVVHNVFI